MIYYILIPSILYLISLFIIKKNIVYYILYILSLQVYLPFFIFTLFPSYGFATGTYIHISIILTYITFYYFNYHLINNRTNMIFNISTQFKRIGIFEGFVPRLRMIVRLHGFQETREVSPKMHDPPFLFVHVVLFHITEKRSSLLCLTCKNNLLPEYVVEFHFFP